MSKYVVITWPDIQDYMDLDGFEENSYLVNDEQGIEDFGSSAYFVDEEWLDSLEDEDKPLSDSEKRNFVDGIVTMCLHTFEDDEDYTFDEPLTLDDGRVAVGFYQDDGNEDVRIVIEENGQNVEDGFLSSMADNHTEDAYQLALRIDNFEYHLTDDFD